MAHRLWDSRLALLWVATVLPRRAGAGERVNMAGSAGCLLMASDSSTVMPIQWSALLQTA